MTRMILMTTATNYSEALSTFRETLTEISDFGMNTTILNYFEQKLAKMSRGIAPAKAAGIEAALFFVAGFEWSATESLREVMTCPQAVRTTRNMRIEIADNRHLWNLPGITHEESEGARVKRLAS